MKKRTLQSLLICITTLIAGDTLAQSTQLIPFRKADKWGFANDKKVLVIPADFDSVTVFADGMAPVRKGVKWGYVDENGKATPISFDSVETFQGGTGVVWFKGQTRVAGLIDRQYVERLAKPLLSYEYTAIGELASGCRIIKTDKNLYGAVNAQGKLVIPVKYKSLGMFNEGLSLVRDNFNAGFIDTAGKIIIPLKYNSANPLLCSVAAVMEYASGVGAEWTLVDRQGNRIGTEKFSRMGYFVRGYAWAKQNRDTINVLVDSTGRIVLRDPPSIPKAKEPSLLVPNKGVATYLFFENRKAYYGAIDMTGKEIFPPQYSSILNLSTILMVEKDQKWTVHDLKGKKILPNQYDYYKPLKSNLAVAVRTGKKWGLLGVNGKLITPALYDTIGPFNKGLAVIAKGGLYGYINEQGKELIKPKYTNAFVFTDDGLAVVWKKDKAGFIDIQGKEVIASKYDTEVPDDAFKKGLVNYVFRKGIACVRLNGRWGYIDRKGIEYWED